MRTYRSARTRANARSATATAWPAFRFSSAVAPDPSAGALSRSGPHLAESIAPRLPIHPHPTATSPNLPSAKVAPMTDRACPPAPWQSRTYFVPPDLTRLHPLATARYEAYTQPVVEPQQEKPKGKQPAGDPASWRNLLRREQWRTFYAPCRGIQDIYRRSSLRLESSRNCPSPARFGCTRNLLFYRLTTRISNNFGHSFPVTKIRSPTAS
jgi:hypothetical protein